MVYLSKFHERMMPLGRVTVTPEIFKQTYVCVGYGKHLAARIPPHMDTCVHWSAMGVDAILKLKNLYALSYQHGLALLYSVCASNSPDYFRIITNRLLTETKLGENFFKKDPVVVAIKIYEIIFQFKEESSRNKQKLMGQRHQPCGNTQASRKTIQQSLANMITVCETLMSFGKTESPCVKTNVRRVYLQTLNTFCKTKDKGGIFGAGPLIANKIIQMAALLGIFPFQFLMHSAIAKSTKTFTYLKEQFNLDDATKDSPMLLEALAFLTNTNQRIAEGSCCKAAQEYHSLRDGKPIKASDTIYPDMAILYPKCKNSRGIKQVTIYRITKEGEQLVDMKEFHWVSTKNEGVTPWSDCIGYWTGTIDRPPKTTPYQRSRNKKTLTFDHPPKTTPYKQSNKKVTLDGIETSVQKKRKRVKPAREKAEHTWTAFNFPGQADVIISTLECRKALNLWGLLGIILKKSKGKCANRHDVKVGLEHLPENKRLWIPSITLHDGTVYSPPIPAGTWSTVSHLKFLDNRVGFFSKDVAVRYTIIRLLIACFDEALKPFLLRVLEEEKKDFAPQRLFVAPRRRDPMKMVVLYDNHMRTMEPTAVCLKVSPTQGLFVLVDDFGRIKRDTAIPFMTT